MKKILLTLIALMAGCGDEPVTMDMAPPVVVQPPITTMADAGEQPMPVVDAGMPDAMPDATPDATPDAMPEPEPPTLVGEWVVVRTVGLTTCCGKCPNTNRGDRSTTEWVCDAFAGDILCRAQGDTAYETLTFDAGLAGLAEEPNGGVMQVTVTLSEDGEAFTADEELTTASGECTVWRDVEGWRK